MQVFLYNRAALYSTLSLMRLTVDQTNVQPTTDQPTSETTDQRVTVADAALLLGLSEDAVRSRLRRGTLRRETGRDGTVFVVLGTDRPASYQRPTDDRSTNQQNDRQTAGQSIDSPVDSRGGSETYRDELVEALRDEVAHLRDQLDRERDASAELRRIVAGLVQRVPELEAAPEPRNAPKTASEGMANSDDVPSEPERVSWLRRLLRA
jgi:predicted ArsR family transcriptional regulator